MSATLTIRDDSGADDLLRCDPPSVANRDAYRKIASALRAAGARNDARLIDAALSKAGSGAVGAPATVGSVHRPATVSMQNAPLHTSPD
ncbi:hypothetical protein HT746_00940 [Burkholderia pyrrocinia]|uniref:hypothetical protein n=1 Tax=Burkholderia pyrrocinia TaxID=60550 RepID=UPI001576999E|nr:hypothetical protein [Burkholderia pyrrocinia]NTX25729.1 hypothetical protein [Burkholderia pyrrocinia]